VGYEFVTRAAESLEFVGLVFPYIAPTYVMLVVNIEPFAELAAAFAMELGALQNL